MPDILEPKIQAILNKYLLFCCPVAINWCICKGAVPIPGVETVKQAEENLAALCWHLSSDELLQLKYAASKSPKNMIQNIFQTGIRRAQFTEYESLEFLHLAVY
ncbi:hypothetical protein NC652_028886 [Populus alba x Populus x berolinensis]|nr:hypothetical protein NC652_028886 [Populus alba x Populus x berolinensis]